MNYQNYFFVLLIMTLCYSCNTDYLSEIEEEVIDIPATAESTSSQDTEANDQEQGAEGNNSFFSLVPGDNWTYDIMINGEFESEDIITVVDPVVIDGESFSDFETSAGSTGFMSQVLANGLAQEVGSSFVYSGALEFPLDDMTSIMIEINDAVVYDSAQASGTVLSEINQTMEQTIMGFPLTIETTLITTQLDNDQTDVTIGAFVFPNVIKANITVDAEITVAIAGIPFTLLEPQQIYSVTNHYAQDVGMVASWVHFQYELEDLGVDLPFPLTLESTTDQVLTAFDVDSN